jgi:LysM repeat protein
VGHSVDALHDAGVKLLTVASCLDTEAYEHVGDYGVKDDTWTCEGTWTPPSASTPKPSTSPPTTPTPTPTPNSAPPTTTTPACKETYTSAAGDDCTKIEAKYNLVSGTLKAANPFVTCTDIWAWTPLCIPNGPYNTTPAGSSPPATTSTPACKQKYTSVPNDTCASIENKFNLAVDTIKAANPFLTCTDIWASTPICVPDGPYKSKSTGSSEPSCVTQTYQSLAGETWCVPLTAPMQCSTQY